MHVMLGSPVSDPKIILTDMDKNPDPIPIDDKKPWKFLENMRPDRLGYLCNNFLETDDTYFKKIYMQL
jgi:hypothetical protein